jgi:hypothetical protein
MDRGEEREPLYILMVYSLKLSFVANSNNLTDVGLALGETICFGSLEFTADHFSCLSLNPEEDSGAIFVGMVHSRSPSLHTTLEDLSNEGDATLSKGGSSGLPGPKGVMCYPDCPHHNRTTAREHSGTSDHPNGPAMDRHTAARYNAPP